MHKAHFIIGGGISGLICSFYNPNSIVISKNTGGQLNNEFPLGPRLLQKNEYTKRLLDDLGLNCNVKEAKIGYSESERIFTNETNEKFRLNYYQSTRTNSSIADIPASVMSENKNVIEYYDVDLNDIVILLSRHVNIYNSTVTEIDVNDKSILLSDGNIFTYSDLTSTVPLPLLIKISKQDNIEHDFSCLDKTYVLAENFNNYLSSYDYIYYNDEMYNRVTSHLRDNKQMYIIEYTNKKILDIYKQCEDCGIVMVDVKTQKNAQICNNCYINPFEKYNIKLLGRYAQWQHNIKTQDVIKECINDR